MSSKERALTAIARQKPDRVPIDYSTNTGIDLRLKQHFGLQPTDDERLLQALGVDFRSIYAPFTGPNPHPQQPGVHVNEWGVHTRWVEHESGGYWDYCDFPLKHASLKEVEAWSIPSPDDFDYHAAAEQCRQYSDYCIVAGNAGIADIINGVSLIRNMEQVLVDLMTDNPAGLRLIDRRMEVQLAMMERTLEACQGQVDVFYMGEDLGTQLGPLISLKLYRKHLRPRHQKFVDLAKAYHLPVMMHSCGSSSWAYDDFIEMGITVVDTLQPEAANMSPAYLKERYGDRLAFHGCISTAGPVAYGSVENVVADVKRTLEIMMPGGGYLLAPTHQLQDNSPTENVVSMYEAAHKYGVY